MSNDSVSLWKLLSYRSLVIWPLRIIRASLILVQKCYSALFRKHPPEHLSIIHPFSPALVSCLCQSLPNLMGCRRVLLLFGVVAMITRYVPTWKALVNTIHAQLFLCCKWFLSLPTKIDVLRSNSGWRIWLLLLKINIHRNIGIKNEIIVEHYSLCNLTYRESPGKHFGNPME